ncbi:MAG: metallophosphoesterase family protein [Terriglobales bacterium]
MECPTVVCGHIHRPFVRQLGVLTVANSGSAGLSYDGDRRACYVIVEKKGVTIRRVEYDVDREIQELHVYSIPMLNGSR